MKLQLNECACTKKGKVYCRTQEGYRFTTQSCPPRYYGKKLPK